MRTVLLSLLAAALCLHTAHSLQCYTCFEIEEKSICSTITHCSSDGQYCLTNVTSVSGKTVITKQCVTVCTPVETENKGTKISNSSFQTDLCNYNGAKSVRISYLTLLISVGFVSSLLRAGL
ncbi:lymphocyte antigen 6E [Microcaecilia unicolor]|uniref:Lymphocyte antigen 6E-like n=1 Tax=Microcaecilia unicolor TaxID=1415580 RepID=A0A6P7X7A8_9AMPH|nr:lymphocyte antigen 6E-like [Microcaecilia unicolor]